MMEDSKKEETTSDINSFQYLHILKQVSLFNGLTTDQLLDILKTFPLYSLKPQDILFNQGDDADAIYVLLSGRLIALLQNDQEQKIIGSIKVGEVVGEMGFITHKSRSLTIMAATESKLLKLSEENFNYFLQLVPSVIRQIMLNAISRGQSSIQKLAAFEKGKKDFLFFVLPANESVEIKRFSKMLKSYCFDSGYEKFVYILEHDELKSVYEQRGLAAILDYLDELSFQYDSVVYFGEPVEMELQTTLLKHSDVLTIVADGRFAPSYSPYVLSLLEKQDLVNLVNTKIKKQLVLLWNQHSVISGTRLWLVSNYYSVYYHIKERRQDYQRLLRLLAGRAIGLVLSGGATRGWTHVGVIKALTEKNIPVDFIAAVSSGAGVATCYTIYEHQEKMLQMIENLVEASKRSSSWRALTLPFISIYDCAALTKALKETFRDQYIEDIEIPYYVLVTNLSTSQEILVSQGLIWKSLRCSASLPGLYPPFVENGEILIDGGMINNLPTDHMRKIFGKNATIIASDLGAVDEDKELYNFPPILSFKDLLMNIFTKKYKMPQFFSTFLKSTLIGSYEKYIENIGIADYCIRPNLKGFKLLDFKEETKHKLIEIGYEEALETLKTFNNYK